MNRHDSSTGEAPDDVPSLTRRQLLAAAGGAAATFALGALPAPGGRAEATERPNILWFVSEDNGASFIGAYGNELARTPTIDRLAEDGVRYRNFHTTSPVCAPTKLGLLTGMYESSMGPGHHMRARYGADGQAGYNAPEFVRGYGAYLQDVGYWVTQSGNMNDYNTEIDESGIDDTSGDWQARPAGTRFLAVIGSQTSHETSSFVPVPGETDPAAVRLPAYHPDTEVMRRDRARYMEAVAEMDGELAQELQRLEDSGEAENTIVIYSSDHGGVLPRSKRFCYDSGLHAPFIIRFPDRWKHLALASPGSVVDAPVSSIDVPPTILSLAGVDLPDHMHGTPFLQRPTTTPAAAAPRIYAFSNRNRMDQSIDFVRTVRDERYRYIRNYMPHLPWGQHVMFMWLQQGVQEWERLFMQGQLDEVQARFWGPKPAEELYDLQTDPDEVVNLIEDPRRAGRVARMRAALDVHMLEINDNGFIPEGSPAEGWYASREPGAYPLDRLIELGNLAIRREPSNVPVLLGALADDNYVVRCWGALGCAMLGTDAAPAVPALTTTMETDPERSVQVQAADALVHVGRADLSVPFLSGVVGNEEEPQPTALQAVWALHYAGSDAIPALHALTDLAARRAMLDNYDGEAARYAIRTISGTYVPAP